MYFNSRESQIRANKTQLKQNGNTFPSLTKEEGRVSHNISVSAHILLLDEALFLEPVKGSLLDLLADEEFQFLLVFLTGFEN